MIRRILNLYRFTYSEQKSLLLLCALLVFVNGISHLKNRLPEENFSFIQHVESKPEGKDLVSIDAKEKPPVRKAISKQKNNIPLLEINSSDSIAFLSLYGIGPVFAGRIVKFRSLLGGYHNCDQLLEVYGMDSIRYLGFKKKIYVDASVIKRLNINTSVFRDLLRHPYLEYDAVKQLVQYRDKVGPMESPQNLWRDSVLSDDIRQKLIPYLTSS